MHITRLDIENFGPFYDRPLTAFSPGLTLIHGPNEAGKSALRAFVRAVFFGYMRKNEKGYDFYRYDPVRGGAASGSVGVRMSNGASYTVHRKEGPNRGPVLVTPDSPNGTNGERRDPPAGSKQEAPGRGGAEMLDELLGRIGPELYQNVFSISLSELQSLETLNAPQIRDRIYSVGLGLSRVSLPDALEKLDAELKELRSPRAGRIRSAEKEIADLRAQIERARAETGRYAAVVTRKTQLDDEIAQRRDALVEIRERLARQRKLIDLHPHWERMQELERQLAGTPDMPSFPVNGEKQLDEALRQLADIEKRVQEGDLKQKAKADQFTAVPVVEAFARQDDAVRRLLSETDHYRSATEDLPVVERQLHDEQTKLARELELLGPDWTGERVTAFTWPDDFKAQMNAAAGALSAARDALHEADADVRHRTDEHQQAAEAHQRTVAARDALKDVPQEGIEPLEARSDKLRRIKAAISDATVVEAEKRNVERLLSEGLARVQPQAVNNFIFGTVWTGVIIIVLGLAAVGYGFWKKELAGAIPGGLAVLAGAVTLGRAIITGKGMKIVLTRPKIGDSNDVLKKQAEDLKARIEAVAKEVAALAAEVKLTGTPTVRQVEEQLALIGRGMDRRRSFDSLAAQAKESEARAKGAEQHRNAAAAKQVEAKSAHTSAQEKWQEVLFTGGLRPELDPSGAAGMVGTIQSAKGQQKIVESLRDRVQKMRETIADIEARLAALLTEAQLPAVQPGLALAAMRDLQQRYTEHQRALERADHIEEEMKDWTRERDLLEKRQSQVQARRAALLGDASAKDEQEFRAAGARVARHRDLTDKLEDLKLSHPMLVNEVGRPYRERLAKLTPEEMQPKLDAFEEAARQQDEKLRVLHTELGQVVEQKRVIEESNPTGELHLRLGQLEERQKEDARRWAVLTVARDMLETTREQFQRERQPALLLSASRYFQSLTLGRYTKVETVVGEDRFDVVEGASRRKVVADLSRGTAEQLYLAMRFALIEEYARNAEPLPVVMDDVLVNFDPDRARAACSAVIELSSQFQVVFLTCHPQTVEYFRDMAPQAGAASNGRSMSVLELPSSARAA